MVANNYGPKFNGLYQDLAYLYAATGKPKWFCNVWILAAVTRKIFTKTIMPHMLKMLPTLRQYFILMELQIISMILFMDIASEKIFSTLSFITGWFHGRCLTGDVSACTNFYAGGGGQIFSNLNLKFSSDEMLSFFFAKLKEEILKIKDINERNFNLAVTLKNEGIFYAYRKEIRGI